MKAHTIGLIAAMPEEVRPLLKSAERFTRGKAGQYTIYRFQAGGKNAILIESGIGMEHAAAATEKLIATAEPDVIVSFGFGGSVLPGLKAGDLVVGRQSLCYRSGEFSEQEGIDAALAETVARQLVAHFDNQRMRVVQGEIITSASIANKQKLAGLLPAQVTFPVLDMETAAVTVESARRGIPVLALRAISDSAEEELDFSLEEFTDREMNIRLVKIIYTVVKRPRIIPQLIRLAGNAKIAANTLSIGIAKILETL